MSPALGATPLERAGGVVELGPPVRVLDMLAEATQAIGRAPGHPRVAVLAAHAWLHG